MAKLTIADRLIAALERRGCFRVETKTTRRYVVLTRTEDTFYFVGRNGALRYGRNSTSSVAASDRFKDSILNGSA